MTAPDLYAVPRPGSSGSPGTVASVFINWGPTPTDLDFYMRTSTGQRVGYLDGYNAPPNNVPEVIWDNDDTNGTGPETMTFTSLVANKRYKFYVHNWSNQVPGTTTWGDRTKVRLRMFDSTCFKTPIYMVSSGGGIWWSVMTMSVNGSGVVSTSEINTFSDTEPGNP